MKNVIQHIFITNNNSSFSPI